MSNYEPVKIASNVHWVGVNDSKTALFEAFWEIPEGVSYNSYLVCGSKKTALIDSVHKNYVKEHLDKIGRIIDPLEIDYIIINHMEPDHTGAIPELLSKAPNAQLVLTPLALNIYSKYYHATPKSIVVKGDGINLSLGDKTLQFLQTPWLHWPETMSTYLQEEKILFSCDAFGTFGTLPKGAVIENSIPEISRFINASKKYFATVFYGQREWILKALTIIQQQNLDVQMLAPSHGPVYLANSKQVMANWTSWSRSDYAKKAVIIYSSMYNMTAKCVEPIIDVVKEAGGEAVAFNLSEKTPGEVITELVDTPLLIIGCPTYEHEIFPKVKQFLDILHVKKFSNRTVALFGSFSWSGEATRKLNEQLTAMGFKILDKPVMFFGDPTPQDIEKVKTIAKNAAQNVFTKKEP